MKKTQLTLLVGVIASTLLMSCESDDNVLAPGRSPHIMANVTTSSSITAIDISNGVADGGARTISNTGVILGKIGTTRGWWQSPSPSFTAIDNGWVQSGNRNADAGGTQGTALLSTQGGPPWTSVTLASPPGTAAGMTVAHDINDSRVLVGFTKGTVRAIRWENPTAVPVVLPLPSLDYPVDQSVAKSISNSGVIVGYVIETLPKKRTRYEAIVWSGGSVSILPWAPGATSQLASNVNDAGVISGIVNGSHPARWTPRADGGYDVVVSTLDAGRHNLETGIDACGRVTGGSDVGAWVWDGVSAPVILPGPVGPGYAGWAYDISESGTLVGSSVVGMQRGNLVWHATIWTGLPSCPP